MPDTSSINDQILDQLSQIGASLKGSERVVLAAAAYQAIAQAIALALQNAVAQQQHNAILRNALTTAAANAILEGKRDEAHAILQLAESKLATPSLTETVQDLNQAFQLLRDKLKEMEPQADGGQG